MEIIVYSIVCIGTKKVSLTFVPKDSLRIRLRAGLGGAIFYHILLESFTKAKGIVEDAGQD